MATLLSTVQGFNVRRALRKGINHGNYLLTYINLIGRGKRSSDGPTVFHLSGPRHGFDRTLFCLGLPFLQSGNIVFVKNWLSYEGYDFYRRADRYSRLFLRDERVRLCNDWPHVDGQCLVHDGHLPAEILNKPWGHVFEVSFDFSLESVPAPFVILPFTMHPSHYLGRRQEGLGELRRRENRSRVFFSGGVSSAYTALEKSGIKERFDMLDRNQVVRALERHPKAKQLSSFRELSVFKDKRVIELLMLTDDAPYSKRVPDQLWHETLAGFDFFVCPPGFSQPLCHNAVEAMSVGCIPIINYPRWFVPSLSPNFNCLVFQTTEELLEQLDRALAMSSDELRRLREGVLQYYDRYLETTSVRQRLMSGERHQKLFAVSSHADEPLKLVNPSSLIFSN